MKRAIFILMAVLILPALVYSQGVWVPFTSGAPRDPPIIEVLESNNSRTVIHVIIPGMWVKDTIIDGSTYQILKIPSTSTMCNIGAPQLPAIRKLVAIPPISNVSISIDTITPLVLSGYMVFPCQEPVPIGQPPCPFIIDTLIYSTNAFYPEAITEIANPAICRDVRVANTSVYPITFNPVTQELNVYYDFTIRLDYYGTSNINPLPEGYPSFVDPMFEAMYKNLIVNYEWLGISTERSFWNYLVITATEYYDELQDFVFWKHKKGCRIVVVRPIDIVFRPYFVQEDTVAIRDYIRETFVVAARLGYVLLVGDEDAIPMVRLPNIYPEKIFSDHWYTCINGDDDYPDIAIGRISVASSEDVNTIISKIFAYERKPAENWAIRRALMVSHYEEEVNFSFHDTTTKIISEFLEPNSFDYYDVWGLWGYTNEDVKDYIENGAIDYRGVGIVNYFGHGEQNRWFEWNGFENFTTIDVHNLTNQNLYPVVYNCACWNGAIQEEYEVMVEAWIRDPDGGGVGALGASERVRGFAGLANHIPIDLFRAPFDLDIHKVGWVLNYAKDRLIQEENPFVLPNVYAYNWFGDPELSVWTDTPKTLTVNHVLYVSPGASFTVEVTDIEIPVENALVCIWKGEEIYEIRYTNISGEAVFTLSGTATRGEMYVTVTAHNYIPYEGIVRIGIFTDDPQSLAYNGNHHLVREPNTDNLHLVYTDAGKVWYRYSDDGGDTWTLEEEVGIGDFPAIALASDNMPCVTSTRFWLGENALLFKKRRATGFPPVPYIIYDYVTTRSAAHPSIAITYHPAADEDTVHILSRTYQDFLWNAIREFSFPVSNPGIITERILDYTSDAAGVVPYAKLDFPSIARTPRVNTDPQLLHGVWMHGDTVYYAMREIGGEWDVKGWQFQEYGLQSDHPFVETYGDSVYVVWQHRSFMNPEEVYKGKKQIGPFDFIRYNISNTPYTESVYPVNASGLVSLFANEIAVPPPDSRHEIFWTTNGDIFNLSNTPQIKSTFPHASLRVTSVNPVKPPTLYTVWLEGSNVPYEIISSRMYVPFGPSPFFTSRAGSEIPSLYLVKRDFYIPEWDVPVDVGYKAISYQFQLDPIYRYYLKAIAYHESEGEWREWVTVDKKMRHLIKYEAYEPETLGFWIPPAFYKDGVVDVDIEHIKGKFATIGPIYIYRCEYEEEKEEEIASGGLESGTKIPTYGPSLKLTPNPFNDRVLIDFIHPQRTRVKVSIFDISGRLVKKLYDGKLEGQLILDWRGKTKNGSNVSAGVYFLRIEDLASKEVLSRKLIKIQ